MSKKSSKKSSVGPSVACSPFPARYEVLTLLGRGGGGEVWSARDCATGQKVAIKALHTGFDPAEAEALVRETTTLSGLEGMGFPRVLSLGRARDGRLYLVRELVEGESFERVQQEEPRRALSLLCSAANVLTVVHRAGLLHGDIKPANLIVRPEGSVALVDLGLATALREGGQNSVGLTPHFAAPEVRAGGALTVQAEVFSLGIIARDLLSEGADAELSGKASDALHSLVVRATRTDPTLRFPSVDEFAQVLRAALGGDVGAFAQEGPPWPVRGLDATAYRFKRALDALEAGQTLRVLARTGSGTSTVMRRASWEEALLGKESVYLEEHTVASGHAQVEIESLGNEGLVFFDALSTELDATLDEAARRGVRIVRLTEQERGNDFQIPPLELPVIRALFRGALPGMPEPLVERVVERLGGAPGSLRNFALLAQGVPVATEPDVDRALSGVFVEAGSALEVLERNLDRGHYVTVTKQLRSLSEEDPRSVWLKARFELAAGSAAEALRFCRLALELQPDSELSERIAATCSRAHLGLGQYDEALSVVVNAESFHPEAQAEALAYRGLGLTLLERKTEALEALKRGYKCATELGSQRLSALVGTSLATAQWRSGDHEGAAQSYKEAMEAARQVGDSGMLASTQINLAGLMKERGDLASSIEFLEGALDAARRAGRATSSQQALLNLANTDLYLGRLERARTQIAQLGDPAELLPALRAQYYGLRAELLARSGEVETALDQYTLCENAWRELGRLSDAGEAALEAVLVAADVPKRADRNSATFIPTLDSLSARLKRGQESFGQESALLALAQARVTYFSGEAEQAETDATRAFQLATEGGHREWAWRASSLRALILESAGKRSRAARARREAVEILEDIGAHLPPDLRAVYWSEARRRSLRAMTVGEGGEVPLRSGSPDLSRTNYDFSATGTELVSRLSMTPLERRLARVLAINSDLAGEVDLSRLATKIIGHACELLSAERGYLLLGTSADSLQVCASRGGQGSGHEEFSRSIAAEVLRDGAPLVSVDAGRDQRLQAFESVHLSQVSAVACVPVMSPKSVPIGALYVETRSGVRPGFGDEVPTLQAFSDQAAIAIENSRLIGELREKTEALEQRNRHLKEARARLKEILGKRTARLREVKKELSDAKSRLSSHASYAGMVVASDEMRRIYSLIERIKDTDVPVLITGESGTGKEIAARAIYEGSARQKGKLLAVNCGAIPESILESELFGHVKGAFTSADRDRKGLFREADGGVLFLDEVGETPLKMQASLLRALQEGKVRPVGGGAETSVDVRVIFATNRDLKKAVAEGNFREDLLYRIQVIEIALPPLRKRKEDIPLLCEHFLSIFSLRFDQAKKSLSRRALARLLDYPFPGNIRQLENILLNAWILSDEEIIEAEDLQLPQEGSIDASPPQPSTRSRSSSTSSHARAASFSRKSEKKGTLSEHQRGERREIVEALEATGWNRLKAAAVMNMPRRTFYRRLREYNIQ